MDKQKRQAIGQMVIAALMCAAVVIPSMVWVNAATEKEQTARGKQAEQETAVVMVAKETESVKEPTLKYWDSIPLDSHLQNYIVETSNTHGIAPEIVMAMIERESQFDGDCIGDDGDSYGLMQIQVKWHYERMQRLGCTDLLNPYDNVTVGIDYLCEQLNKYGDMAKALTAYNRGHYNGTVTEYAKTVLAAAERLGETDALHG